MEYKEFLKTKQKKHIHSGFDIEESELNSYSFPFQKFIVKRSLKAGKYAIFADCGLGKTLMQLEWANQVNQHTNKPVLILAPLAVGGQTVKEGLKFGIPVIKYDGSNAPIQISNYEQLENIDVSIFSGIVLDECFAPDTEIQIWRENKLHNINIKDCLIGDQVLNCIGLDTVTSIKKKKIPYAIKIKYNGKEIISSPRHPYFTSRGWVAAKNIQRGDIITSTDKAMRILRGEFSDLPNIGTQEKILQSILFSEMENEAAAIFSECSQSNGSCEKGQIEVGLVKNGGGENSSGAHKKIKPDAAFGNPGESICYTESDESPTFSAWGQWSIDDITAAINEGCIVRELDSGICHITGKATEGLPDQLQSGLSSLREENCNRSGWSEPLQPKGNGYKERSEADFFRVENFEVLEQGCSELDKYRDETGSLYFYDLEIKRHPSFTINGGLVHNSSILKNFTGVYKNLIIDKFSETKFKLACTATPAPNDLNEIGNHSEFLDVMDSNDMRMRWFVRDEGMNNYRLKGHAETDFYGWIANWASVLRSPADIGFSSNGYDLPPLNYFEKLITTNKKDNGQLFNETSVNATEFNRELRLTIIPRLECVSEIVNNSTEPFIVWVNQNEEEEKILSLIPDAVAVRGSESPDRKESKLLGFANGDFRVLVTKKKIAQFGLNYQHCSNQIFASLDFSFEGLYQAIRRSYRFGQKNQVNIWLITTDTMTNVIQTIRFKQDQFNKMMEGITRQVNSKKYSLKSDYDMREEKTEFYHLMNGDSCDLIKTIEDNSIDLSVFSPPFSTLFTYSDNIRDMGNCVSDEEFFEQQEYLLKDLYRIMKPGRLVCVHSKDLARYKNSSGYSGMWDFTGEYHRAMEKAGFRYHSKITIWLDPALEMQRTKTQRLLYKQVTSDASYTGIGMPEYITIFRKWEGDESEWTPITNKTKKNFDLNTWQKWASPVWFDIKRTDVLNNYKGARNEKDEKHIAPLQLDVIERLIALWSNPGEVVFTPFMGIGSEVFQAVKMGRIGKGIELKESYYDLAKKNLQSVVLSKNQLQLL